MLFAIKPGRSRIPTCHIQQHGNDTAMQDALTVQVILTDRKVTASTSLGVGQINLEPDRILAARSPDPWVISVILFQVHSTAPYINCEPTLRSANAFCNTATKLTACSHAFHRDYT